MEIYFKLLTTGWLCFIYRLDVLYCLWNYDIDLMTLYTEKLTINEPIVERLQTDCQIIQIIDQKIAIGMLL